MILIVNFFFEEATETYMELNKINKSKKNPFSCRKRVKLKTKKYKINTFGTIITHPTCHTITHSVGLSTSTRLTVRWTVLKAVGAKMSFTTLYRLKKTLIIYSDSLRFFLFANVACAFMLPYCQNLHKYACLDVF